LQDKDSFDSVLFLKSFFWIFFASGVLGFFLFGLTGVLIAAIFSIVASMIAVSASDQVGGMAATLYTGHAPARNLRAQLVADLDGARHHKRHKRFVDALSAVNKILAQDPDFPDALFLKAQILFEGFEDVEGAKKCLTKVMEVVKNKRETIYRWASSFHDELTKTKHGPAGSKAD
jgi:hypothetical protein